MVDKKYIIRHIDQSLQDLLKILPGVMIAGPRATGKSTTARRYAKTVVSLDSPSQSAFFRSDPDAALLGLEEPVLFDEWQEVPGILGALKRSIDLDYRPGRFILAGSVHAKFDQLMWPATGRLAQVEMFGLTMAERLGSASTTFIPRLEIGSLQGFPPIQNPPNLRDYVSAALKSGFPEALQIEEEIARRRWLRNYLQNVLSRDVVLNRERRSSVLARQCFQAFAATMATSTTETRLYQAIGVARNTFIDYERMLEEVYAIQQVPGWAASHLGRLRTSPKRYVLDTGLGVEALGRDINGVLGDGDLLGKVLDNFVFSQIRPEMNELAAPTTPYHLRENAGRHEVDLLFEVAGQGIVALEIKATAAPALEDARHLIWLRDRLGDRFLAGAVMHTGPRPFQLADRILALPIYSIWSAHGLNNMAEKS